MTNLVIKKRRIPVQVHVHNFYGDLKRGYFTFADGKTFFSSSVSLDERDDVCWILIPKQLSTGRLIAWPNFKSSLNKLSTLCYFESSKDCN